MIVLKIYGNSTRHMKILKKITKRILRDSGHFDRLYTGIKLYSLFALLSDQTLSNGTYGLNNREHVLSVITFPYLDLLITRHY